MMRFPEDSGDFGVVPAAASSEDLAMATAQTTTNRRVFLKASLAGGLAAAGAMRLPGLAAAAEETRPAKSPPSRVALTAGNDRAENAFRGLKPFEQEIARAIGDRRVVIKPNNVAIDIQLSATHADCLEGHPGVPQVDRQSWARR